MDYKVRITDDALADLDLTKDQLARVAGSIRLCENPRLRERGYVDWDFKSIILL